MSAKITDENNYNKAFPSRLRALLDNDNNICPLGRKVTQVELAQAFHDNGIPITRQTISLYANGDTTPDIEKFKFIADYFKVSYDFLLGASDAINRDNIQICNELGISEKAIDTVRKINEHVKFLKNKEEDIWYVWDLYLKAISFSLSADVGDLYYNPEINLFVAPIIKYAINSPHLKHKLSSDDLMIYEGYLKFEEWSMIESQREFALALAKKLIAEKEKYTL